MTHEPPQPTSDPGPAPQTTPRPEHAESSSGDRGTMIPSRARRSIVETMLMRVVATAGIIAIGVVIAAIMRSQGSQGWLIGLVVSAVTVVLAAVLWSSRRL